MPRFTQRPLKKKKSIVGDHRNLESRVREASNGSLYRFFKNMSDREYTNYIRQNFQGYTIKEFEEKCWVAYNDGRKRDLIELLEEEGILIRNIRDFSFPEMSNEELIEFIVEKYKGKTINEFQRSDSMVYKECWKRGLISLLEKEGVLIRKKRPKGFFLKMSDKEILDYIKQNHYGKRISEIQGSRVYDCLRQRKLLGKAVDAGLLVRERRINPFPNISDSRLIEYVRENHKGKTISQFEKDDGLACREIRGRGLMETFIGRGILIRKQRANGFYSDMTNYELLEYTRRNYHGSLISILDSSEARLHLILSRRNLIDRLVEEGTLIRRVRKPGLISTLSNKELFDYVKELYNGMTLSQLTQEDKTVYREVKERKNLEKKLMRERVLIRKGKGWGFFSTMSDKELINYTKKNWLGESISTLQRKEPSLYPYLNKRKLLDKLVEEGILIRIRDGIEESRERDSIPKEFVLRKYVGLFWNNPFPWEGVRPFIRRFGFAKEESIEFLKKKFKSVEGGYIMSQEYKEGISFLDYITQDIDTGLKEKVFKLDSKERLLFFFIEKYIDLFWKNPLPRVSDKGRYIMPTLSTFARAFDHNNGQYVGDSKGTFLSFFRSQNTKPEDGQIRKVSFFEYIAMNLDEDEIIEKARQLDSGERLKEYLAEQTSTNVGKYLGDKDDKI